MTIFDDPNREAVGLAPIWTGADADAGGFTTDEQLDAMTKAELLEYAAAHGVVADESMLKADIRALIG